MARRNIAMAASHLSDATATMGKRYEEGVSVADWQTPAGSDQAEDNYAAGVAEAVSAGSRKAGVLRVSNAAWQEAARVKGGPVIGTRVKAALQKYTANFGPVLQAANSAADQAAPRTRDFRQNVANRMLPVIEAMKRAAGKPV